MNFNVLAMLGFSLSAVLLVFVNDMHKRIKRLEDEMRSMQR